MRRPVLFKPLCRSQLYSHTSNIAHSNSRILCQLVLGFFWDVKITHSFFPYTKLEMID